jgi:type VI secretion system Hcp family effector
VAGEFDAYLRFVEGKYGKGQSKILNVHGETKDVAEKNNPESDFGSIQLKRYDMGVSQDTKTSEESQIKDTDNIVADPKFNPVTITKQVDISTPYLLQAVYVGAIFTKAHIWQRRAGASREVSGGYFLKIELRDVSVVDLKWSAGDGIPEETLSLEYRGIKVEYLRQLASGALDKSAPASTDMLWLPKAKNDQTGSDKGGGALSTSDKADLVKQVTDAIRRANPTLKLR